MRVREKQLMTAFERDAHSALWWVVPMRWDASQCRLAVFQAFGAETNRGTAAASQATNGGDDDSPNECTHPLRGWGGGSGGEGGRCLWVYDSLLVLQPNRRPISFSAAVCTTEETHILNTCWLILLFLSLGLKPPHPSPAFLSVSPQRTNLIWGSEEKKPRGKLIARSQLSHHSHPQDRMNNLLHTEMR